MGALSWYSVPSLRDIKLLPSSDVENNLGIELALGGAEMLWHYILQRLSVDTSYYNLKAECKFVYTQMLEANIYTYHTYTHHAGE